jgi:hypothetical protein
MGVVNAVLSSAAALLGGAALTTVPPAQAAPQPEPPCCATEFDGLLPYTQALENHGLGYLNSKSIGAALAVRDACGLVPAIGAVATVEKLARDNRLPSGTAGQLVVAAADVCPEIGRMLG